MKRTGCDGVCLAACDGGVQANSSYSNGIVCDGKVRVREGLIAGKSAGGSE